MAIATIVCLGLAPSGHGAQFSAGVDLVEVYATVTGADGHLLPGLSAADFRVTEDGTAQSVAVFAHGDVPLAVAVAIDRSFSLSAAELALAVTATRRFVAALQPADQLMLMAFGTRTEILSDLSTDRARATATLDGLEPWGTTPLYDAVLQAIDRVHNATGRRALIVISDGLDTYSRTSATLVIEYAKNRNVLVYPVIHGGARTPELTELAAVTGGRVVEAADVADLVGALETIAAELRAQYLLGYTPTRPLPGTPAWRAIAVSVSAPGARVRARDGYMPR